MDRMRKVGRHVKIPKRYRPDVEMRGDKQWDFEYDYILRRFRYVPSHENIVKIDQLSARDRGRAREIAKKEYRRIAKIYGIEESLKDKFKHQRDKFSANMAQLLGSDSVFGVKLTTLLERDKRIDPSGRLPVVVKILFVCLGKRCHEDKGVLIEPARETAKVIEVQSAMAKDFHGNVVTIEEKLTAGSPRIAGDILKFFLRHLPNTLFTSDYADAFCQLGKIHDKTNQLKAAKMLIFMLPDVNANVLMDLMLLLQKISGGKSADDQNVKQLAWAMTPDLFDLPDVSSKESPYYLATQMLINNADVLFTVPPFMNRELEKRERGEKDKPSSPGTILPEGELVVTAPQFNLVRVKLKIGPLSTVADVLRMIFERVCNKEAPVAYHKSKGVRLCLMVLTSPEVFLREHCLYEVGGNIFGEIKLPHEANITNALRDNPRAGWRVRCTHDDGHASRAIMRVLPKTLFSYKDFCKHVPVSCRHLDGDCSAIRSHFPKRHKSHEKMPADKQWDFEYDVMQRLRYIPSQDKVVKIDQLSSKDRDRARQIAAKEYYRIAKIYGIEAKPKDKITHQKDKPSTNVSELVGHNSVFGVKLKTLMERDRKMVPNCRIPLVIKMLIDCLNKKCHQDKGVMSVPSKDVAAVVDLQTAMAKDFYGNLKAIEEKLMKGSPKIAADVLKFFIRHLPNTLFTSDYADAFHQLPKIYSKSDQLKATKMLVLLLPDVNGNVLIDLMLLLHKIAGGRNRKEPVAMHLAFIMTPVLFGVSEVDPKKPSVAPAANTLYLDPKDASAGGGSNPSNLVTQLMIDCADILFVLPPFMANELKQKHERDEGEKPSLAGAAAPEGEIRIMAPQFNLIKVKLKITPLSTAGDVLSMVFERMRNKVTPLADYQSNGIHLCLMELDDLELFLRSHCLCEVGGNISAEKKLPHEANIEDQLRENPKAEWHEWDFNYFAATKRFERSRGHLKSLETFNSADRQKIRELAQVEFQRLVEKYSIVYSTKKIDLAENEAKAFIGRNSVFGVKLSTLLKRDRKANKYHQIPLVAKMLFDCMEHHGYRSDGLMRKAAEAKRVREIKEKMATDFLRQQRQIKQELMDGSVNLTVHILKFFIRLLPGTIFTKYYADACAQLGNIKQRPDRLRAMKMLIFQLPDVNANVLNAFLMVMENVAANVKHNQMDVDAIARVVTTSLFNVTQEQMEAITGKPLENHPPFGLTEMLIENRAILFTVPPFILAPLKKAGEHTSKAATEWDFKWSEKTANLTLETIPTDLGITYIEDLSDANIKRVQMWAKMQLQTVLSDRYQQVKMKRRQGSSKPETKDEVVFGTPLAVLIERDQKHYPDPRRDRNVPLALEAMLLYFVLKGGMSEGPSALNDPESSKSGPNRQPLITERNVILTLDRYFHKAVKYSHIALSMAKISDIVYAIKHFLGKMPEPLLTDEFIDVFLQLHNVKDSMDILIIMKLMILQMPKVHRCTLWCLLTFFAQLSARSEKDTFVVVREVLAPFLFPVSEAAKKEMPEGSAETLTRQLTFLMHRYRTTLFTVPVDVVKALRTYDKKTAPDIAILSIAVNSPQLDIKQLKIDKDQKTLRASEVVEIAILSVKDKHCPKDAQDKTSKSTSKEESSKLAAQLTCQWMETCGPSKCNMISTDIDFFADCHRLYEVGGNIDVRRLSRSASPLAVHRENPDVQWEVRCDHPLCMSEFARYIPDYDQTVDVHIITQLTSLCRSPTFDAKS